ncbi:MAG TPA: hypothetical protein DD490_02090, partial [Acidobacteria bacterium]|nr:hypothetical protein [Acidobacteriota bacterium]
MKKISSYLALGTVALVALSALAFWPLYLSKPFRAADGYTHFHAAVGTGWLALLLVQALLIRGDRRSAHQLFGRASFVLAPAFVVSSVLLAHFRFSRMDEATFAREAYT